MRFCRMDLSVNEELTYSLQVSDRCFMEDRTTSCHWKMFSPQLADVLLRFLGARRQCCIPIVSPRRSYIFKSSRQASKPSSSLSLLGFPPALSAISSAPAAEKYYPETNSYATLALLAFYEINSMASDLWS